MQPTQVPLLIMKVLAACFSVPALAQRSRLSLFYLYGPRLSPIILNVWPQTLGKAFSPPIRRGTQASEDGVNDDYIGRQLAITGLTAASPAL